VEFRKIKELLKMINHTGHNNEYDWNADHSEITLLEGEVYNLLNAIEKEFKEVQVTHSPTYPMWQEAVDKITALEAKLKAAEDHAATMEECARVAEGKLALSVPFDVIIGELKSCKKCYLPYTSGCTKQACPLTPKAQTIDGGRE
jgi:hypothetical protein